jgi:hypothetical protein
VNSGSFFTEMERRDVYKVAVSFVPCAGALPLFEVALVLVRLNQVACVIVKRGSQHHVND